MAFVRKSKLPRLEREWYMGRAFVMWTHSLEHRATGWLNDNFHRGFREVLLHVAARSEVAIPAYVLMPDHWHIVAIGLNDGSNQLRATALLRQYTAPLLGQHRLQDQAHDHVLREAEREHGAFVNVCGYVRENPVRANLVDDWRRWPYAGAMVAGYPDLNPRDMDFWERFWKIHNRMVERKCGVGPCAHAQGYEI